MEALSPSTVDWALPLSVAPKPPATELVADAEGAGRAPPLLLATKAPLAPETRLFIAWSAA
jgi:hypothetical protein